jgi:exosortase A
MYFIKGKTRDNRALLRSMLSYYQSNKVYLQLMLLMISVPLIFWPDAQTFVNAWANNTTYNHGFFIFPISIWLLYRQRQSISVTEIAKEPLVLFILALALLLWFLSYIISVNVIQQFAVITLIPISIWILFGRKLLIKIIFPIAFLFFMIPVGASLVPPLMEITADITVSMIELTGIPVFRDGLYFSLPTGNWSVIEACSGLNYLVASLTLGMLYSYLTYRSFTKRLLFVLAITLFALIANGLRAYGIVIIGHLTNMNSGITGDHEFYGWVFYGFFVFWVFYLGNIWADKPLLTQATSNKNTVNPSQGSPPIILFAIIFSIMISIQVFARETAYFDKTEIDNISFQLPEKFGDWQSSPNPDLGWKPQIAGANIEKTRLYVFRNDVVQLSMGYYPWQSQGGEAVSWENQIVGRGSNKWGVSERKNLNIGNFHVTETEVSQQERKMLIWNWYLVGNWETPDPNIAKLFDAVNIIIYRRNDASFLTLATPINISKLDSRKKLAAFHSEAHKELHRILSSVTSEAL